MLINNFGRNKMAKENKALTNLLDDINMDDFHYVIKFGRKREVDNKSNSSKTKKS
jgi:hypothetical protein